MGKSRFLKRNTNAYDASLLSGKASSVEDLEKRQRENFFKNIELHTKKAVDDAEGGSYTVKESTVTRAKEDANKGSRGVLGGFFSRARKSGRGLQFNNLQSYRTVTNDGEGKTLDNGKAPERIPDSVDFGGRETLHKERISSTAIDNINYNPKSRDLLVQFKGNSKKYLFPKVPEDVVRDWLKASSKGRFYNRNVKQYSVAK